jgi:transcriptional regulator with XRE-family HTH domain
MRVAREAEHFSQQMVADLLGISWSYYHRIERGTRRATDRIIREFCVRLSVSFDVILADWDLKDRVRVEDPEGYYLVEKIIKGLALDPGQVPQLFEVLYSRVPERGDTASPKGDDRRPF